MRTTRRERLLNKGFMPVKKSGMADVEIKEMTGKKVPTQRFKEVWERHGIGKSDLIIK